MEGSDDEFSDLDENDCEDEINSSDPTSMHGSPASLSPSSSSWNQQSWSATFKLISIQPFTSPVGPTQYISSSPLEVFNLLFSPDLVEEIVKQSNAYAKTVMGDEKYDKWSKITVDELKAFFGFIILMGIYPFPFLNDY